MYRTVFSKTVIQIPGIRLAHYTTNAVVGIEITPKSEEDIKKGNVIAYKSNSRLSAHEVILTGKDDKGWYAVLRGHDPEGYGNEKVRFEQIEYTILGVIY